MRKLSIARETSILDTADSFVLEEKNSKIQPEKKKSLPEKNIFSFPRQNWKNNFKFLNFCLRKKKKNPDKKIENVPGKTSDCPRKIKKKWARKKKSPEKKTKKSIKKRFLGHF